ncbi:MAG TPA: hypothetical protein VKU35_02760 [Candidatus Limnocylindria bacterium]|nr:hypothetical protein [Candidatus Limnocylindria bacterium]
MPHSHRRGAPLGVVLAALAGSVALWLAVPSPATALCSPPSAPALALQTAPVVFVGTVTSVSGNVATFHVESIWKGTNLSDPIDVDGAAISGEAPRSWQAGTRYLVFPAVDSDGNLLDGGCSPTSVYTSEFDALRPANAHAPQGPPTSGIPGDTPIAGIFLVILVLGSIGGFFLYRTGQRPAGSG